jgi:hypothetical protein
MAQILTLNGRTIKQPTSFRIEKYNLTKAGRTSDGTMHLDFIAAKRKFYFEYEVLAGDELDTILDVIGGTTMFFDITYKDNNVNYSATVYVGAISKKQFRTDGVWYWKDVSFDLIEQ